MCRVFVCCVIPAEWKEMRLIHMYVCECLYVCTYCSLMAIKSSSQVAFGLYAAH